MPKKKNKQPWLTACNASRHQYVTPPPQRVEKIRINDPIPNHLLRAGYKLVETPSREYWQSPGERKFLPNTDRLAKSCLKNRVKGCICKSRKKLKWSGIGLSPTKSKRCRKVSKHASRTFIPVGKENTRHITSIHDFQKFLQDLSAFSKCVNKLDSGEECGGSFVLKQKINRGVGGALIGIVECEKCKTQVRYGESTSQVSSTSAGSSLVSQTTNSIGRSLLFSFICCGRPLHSQYENQFGFFGMDSYGSRTFQRAIHEASKAYLKEQEKEVYKFHLLFCYFIYFILLSLARTRRLQ